jgi:glycosyltransferase involved in cell wall biosynthesis
VILGIDAHCLRGDGGSITHLREVLRNADPERAGFQKVVIWSGARTLDMLEDRKWLKKVHVELLDRSLLWRACWSTVSMSRRALSEGCSVVWAPGCSYVGSFRPFVAMSRNMLPFEWAELRRYGMSMRSLKFLALRASQTATFTRSDGMIYLTEYARRSVGQAIGQPTRDCRVIPHGIDVRFAPRDRTDVVANEAPLKILYVSVVDLYKHQWCVVDAVARLQNAGVRVELDMVGPGYPPAVAKLHATMRRHPGTAGSIRYLGPLDHNDLPRAYRAADVFVYASSCENLPNILLEAMATGLPIACSSRGPMPAILRDAGVYFDPEDPEDIERALRTLVNDPALRAQKGTLALRYAAEYSWPRCAQETFQYLAAVASRRVKQQDFDT